MKLTDYFNRYTEMENCFQKKRVPQISRNHPVSGRTKTMDFGIKDCSNMHTNRNAENNTTSQSFSSHSKERNKSKGKNTPKRKNEINTSTIVQTKQQQLNNVKLIRQYFILQKIKKGYFLKSEGQILMKLQKID